MHASDHPEASNKPVVMDTKLHSSNQHQSMDKPTKLPELVCDITLTTIEHNVIETVEAAIVQVKPETEYSDNFFYYCNLRL